MAAGTLHLHLGGNEVVVFSDEGSESAVYAWSGPGGAWTERQPVPTAGGIGASLELADGRLLVAGGDENRSLFRETSDGWQELGSLAFEPGHVVLTETTGGAVVAYHPRSGELAVSMDHGDQWTALPPVIPASHNLETVGLEPLGANAVLMTGPGFLQAYSVTAGETVPTGYIAVGAPTTSSSVPWSGGQRFGISLAPAPDVDQSEILQVSPYGVLFDAEERTSIGFPCSPPVVTELSDLNYSLFSVESGRVALWHGPEWAYGDNELTLYDDDHGWARVPPLPGSFASARIGMLPDGSMLVVGVDESGVWRWSPV